MAVEQHRKKILKSGKYNEKLEALKFATEETPLEGGYQHETFFLLTGKKSRTIFNFVQGDKFADWINDLIGVGIDDTLSLIQKNPHKYVAEVVLKKNGSFTGSINKFVYSTEKPVNQNYLVTRHS